MSIMYHGNWSSPVSFQWWLLWTKGPADDHLTATVDAKRWHVPTQPGKLFHFKMASCFLLESLFWHNITPNCNHLHSNVGSLVFCCFSFNLMTNDLHIRQLNHCGFRSLRITSCQWQIRLNSVWWWGLNWTSCSGDKTPSSIKHELTQLGWEKLHNVYRFISTRKRDGNMIATWWHCDDSYCGGDDADVHAVAVASFITQ